MVITTMTMTACRAEKIVNVDDECHSESSQELNQLTESRAKCCNNLAAAQMKVFCLCLVLTVVFVLLTVIFLFSS